MKSIKITGFFVLSAVCFVAQGADLQRDLEQEALIESLRELIVEAELELLPNNVQKALDTSPILHKNYFAMSPQELDEMNRILPVNSIDLIIVKKRIENPFKSKEDIKKELMTELPEFIKKTNFELHEYLTDFGINLPYKDWLKSYLARRLKP